MAYERRRKETPAEKQVLQAGLGPRVLEDAGLLPQGGALRDTAVMRRGPALDRRRPVVGVAAAGEEKGEQRHDLQ